MLQIFALEGDELILCSERLIGVQPSGTDAQLALDCTSPYSPGESELLIRVDLSIPAELTVSVHNAEGELIRRLCTSQLTHPSPDGLWHISWDGRDEDGFPAPAGTYTLAAEAVICGVRQKATAVIRVPGARAW